MSLQLRPFARLLGSLKRGWHGRLEASLDRLRADGFRVWNDLRIGGEIVDHAIVGPTGIFAVQCSRARPPGLFRARVIRRGGELDDGVSAAVWQATKESLALQRHLRGARLRVPVHGVVALAGGRLARGAIELGKVAVLTPDALVAFVRSWGGRVTPEQRLVATEILQRGGRVRWHPSLTR